MSGRDPAERPHPRWIFFDCFNTLLDDFDAASDESGMASIAPLAVECGYFASKTSFHAAYGEWRRDHFAGGELRELDLPGRLRAVLSRSSAFRSGACVASLESAVSRMVARFRVEFPLEVRVTPGAREMLDAWSGAVQMGVVSNVFLPGLPRELLERFGLAHHFAFVIDSASVGFKKPHPAIFHAALRTAGTRAEDVLFIGDQVEADFRGPAAPPGPGVNQEIRRMGAPRRHPYPQVGS